MGGWFIGLDINPPTTQKNVIVQSCGINVLADEWFHIQLGSGDRQVLKKLPLLGMPHDQAPENSSNVLFSSNSFLEESMQVVGNQFDIFGMINTVNHIAFNGGRSKTKRL